MARLKRNGAWLIGAGAAVAAGLGYFFSKRRTGSVDLSKGVQSAPALDGPGAAGPVGSSGNVRPAGPEAMRDPPSQWTDVDEASDESFPASDPPAVKHVD